MDKLTKEQYQKQQSECDGLCTIEHGPAVIETDRMRCVTCPFCKQLVDAILTPTTISCPACEVTVHR